MLPLLPSRRKSLMPRSTTLAVLCVSLIDSSSGKVARLPHCQLASLVRARQYRAPARNSAFFTSSSGQIHSKEDGSDIGHPRQRSSNAI
eukprot:2680931-Amphidinium_carterae.2